MCVGGRPDEETGFFSFFFFSLNKPRKEGGFLNRTFDLRGGGELERHFNK